MKYRCKKHGEHRFGFHIQMDDESAGMAICLYCLRDLFKTHRLNQVEMIDDESLYLVIPQTTTAGPALQEPLFPNFRRPQDVDDDEEN
jgi:hypothetical protein